ncbi:unnamed protein product, partial [Gongylonema pulchrum]
MFGRPFATLSDLIQAFISESEATVVPLPPPSAVKLISRQRVAILPFRAMPDTDEIRLEKNGKAGLVAVQLTVPLVSLLPFLYHFLLNIEILRFLLTSLLQNDK